MNYNWIIKVANLGNSFCNPLLKLKDAEFVTRDEACDAIFSAMYDIIFSELGCEMVDIDAPFETEGDIGNTTDVLELYIKRCRDYIFREATPVTMASRRMSKRLASDFYCNNN